MDPDSSSSTFEALQQGPAADSSAEQDGVLDAAVRAVDEAAAVARSAARLKQRVAAVDAELAALTADVVQPSCADPAGRQRLQQLQQAARDCMSQARGLEDQQKSCRDRCTVLLAVEREDISFKRACLRSVRRGPPPAAPAAPTAAAAAAVTVTATATAVMVPTPAAVRLLLLLLLVAGMQTCSHAASCKAAPSSSSGS
jgi:hypothetical protein